MSRTRIVPEGQTILSQGEPASLVGTVVRGTVRLVRTLPDGRQQVVGLIQPGEFFGRPFVEVSEFGYEAATDVEICVTERRAFERALEDNRALERELLQTIWDELTTARERVLLMASLSTSERVATYLLMMLERRRLALSKDSPKIDRLVATSHISRRDLASYLGTTIETISRQLHFFARAGLIRLRDHDHFEILDYEGMVAASGVTEEDLRLLNPIRDLHARRAAYDRKSEGAAGTVS